MRKWSQPAQRNRNGQAWPPAVTLDGSAQTPNGTATSPIARRACSESSSAWACAPDPVAVPVELHRGDPVDGLPAAAVADAVVLLGGVEFAVRHQLAQHVDRDAGVGVALGVGVPVGVEHDLALVELGPVGGAQHRQPVDPGPVGEREAEPGDRAAAVGVAPVGGQQLQLARPGCAGSGRGPAAAGR